VNINNLNIMIPPNYDATAMTQMKDKFIIIDMDNCISDDRWRMAGVDHGIEDLDERYSTYNAIGFRDKPCLKNTAILAQLVEGGAIPVIVTARPEGCRAMTLEWINAFLPFPVEEVIMRPEGDKRHSPVLKPSLLFGWCIANKLSAEHIWCCFDDRDDVLRSYFELGMPTCKMICDENEEAVDEDNGNRTDIILQRMAQTYRERNQQYKSNFLMIAPMIKTLFPDGVPQEVITSHQWHLFELMLVKLSRYAISNLTHTDSIHDAGVYAAMCESINLQGL
jgi:hypothetical protein